MAEQSEDLIKLVHDLAARVGALEEELAELKQASQPEIDEDTLMAISAAVSAYLGNRAKIKAVRFQRTQSAWALQGRAAVQSSHMVSVR